MKGFVSKDPNDFEEPEKLNAALDAIAEWCATIITGKPGSGLTVRLGEVARDYKYEAALFAQGRDLVGVVNAKRVAVGLPPISTEENLHKVTWTMHSLHIVNGGDNPTDKSKAFDFQLFRGGEYLKGETAEEAKLYRIAGLTAEAAVPGLYSGVHFKTPDMDHLQLIA